MLSRGWQVLEDCLDQLITVSVADDAGRDGRAVHHAIELRDVVLSLWRVTLVNDQQFGLVDRTEPVGDDLIERHRTVFAIDDEQDQVRAVDPDLDLPLDVFREIVAVDDADAAGIDQLEVAVPFVHQIRNAVASYTRRRVHDGDELVCEPIENRTLADIRPANDGHLWDGHG